MPGMGSGRNASSIFNTDLDNPGYCHAAVAWRGFQYILNRHFFFFALREMEILARAGSIRVAAQLGSRTPARCLLTPADVSDTSDTNLNGSITSASRMATADPFMPMKMTRTCVCKSSGQLDRGAQAGRSSSGAPR
jgi:hypothetical protein